MPQVMTVVETQLPCEPDLAALSQMQAPIVMVHRITKGEKNRENTQLVINGLTGMSMADILKLQDLLPGGQTYPNSGPGIYRFSVTDGESAAKAVWQTRLGGAVAENPPTSGLPALPAPGTALPFGTMPTAAAVHAVQQQPMVAGVPFSATARPIGNGFYFDEALGLLTAPDGSIHAWRKGQPLPVLNTGAAPVAATPLSAFAGPGVPFFAPQPSAELEAVKQALAASQRALEEAQRRQDELQRQHAQEQREAAQRAEMAELRDMIKTMGAKPQESSEVAELRQRLARQEELAALRAESKAQIDGIVALIREQGGNNRGLDPIFTILTTMMQQGQQAAAETIRMIRETAGGERQTFMTMLDRQATMAEKAAANNPMEKLTGVFDIIVDKLGRVMQLEREFNGSSGGGVDWVGLIKEAVSKAGSAVEMYQQAKAQESAAVTAQANAQTATAQASISRDRALVAIRGGKGTPPAAAGKPAPTAAPAATPAAPAVPPKAPPSTRVKVQLPDLEKATLPELREIFNPERDEVFFGDFFSHVKQLREALSTAPAALGARKIAELLMQAREAIAEAVQGGSAVPHAVEIWAHSQLPYLLERLLPEASEGLRSEVVKALTKLQAEADDAERISDNTATDDDGEG